MNREGPTMTEKINAIKEVLVKLAGEVPDVASLEQAQYAYRKIIYFAGLKFLETFSDAAIGPDPSSSGHDDGKSVSGGKAPRGPHNHGAPVGGPHITGPCLYGAPVGGPHITVIKLVDLVLCVNCPD
jgi:hypothetical protein